MALACPRAAWTSGERALSNMSDHPSTSTFGDIDDPLPDTTLPDVLKAWSDRYHFELWMHMAPLDTLFSRFHWEYRRCTPALVAIEKARSIFCAAKPKKDRGLMLSGDLQLTINRNEDVLVDAAFYGYVGLRVLQNDSAMAGNFLACDLAGSADIVFSPPDANLGNADRWRGEGPKYAVSQGASHV